MHKLRKTFENKQEMIDYLKQNCDWLNDFSYSEEIKGGAENAIKKLNAIDPINYGKTRNYLNGKVTRLSPYIKHGILSLNQVRNHALDLCSEPIQISKFLQELAWRDFWQRVHYRHPEWTWNNIEDYKTGFLHADYGDHLPEDIMQAETESAAINYFIRELTTTGYLHNHARMYLSSYIIHWRRIKWQVGAKWFLHHLIDGDPASNNLSWQWVASTFSNKPYIFNLENLQKYADRNIDTSASNNKILNYSYEELDKKLFPKRNI